ncbi:MAG: arginine repressor [Micrococcales bacterium]|nr:arginine repressor [Micrococcales bacterium]
MTYPSVPSTKVARQAVVVQILREGGVKSQAELAERLGRRGIRATQATISRDLVELGAQKLRGADGGFTYYVPEDAPIAQEPSSAAVRLARLAAELVVAADHSENLLVLHTPPGAAQYLGAALDSALGAKALGTVAGDDTTLTVMRSADLAAEVCARILAGLPPIDEH